MGLYGERVLPRVQDFVMRRPNLHQARQRVCSGLEGQVVEIGFGTGLNARHYPERIEKVAAVEPSDLCMRMASQRLAGTRARVERVGLNGEQLDLPTAEFDAALSTWTLCTIPDATAALEEIRRVLRPGGTFHFVEHGHAPEPSVARWQQRIEPVWKRVAGGCHVTRDMKALIDGAGFELGDLRTYYMEGEPKVFGYTFEGVAWKA